MAEEGQSSAAAALAIAIATVAPSTGKGGGRYLKRAVQKTALVFMDSIFSLWFWFRCFYVDTWNGGEEPLHTE